ncbi:unnamed protein product, partial [Brassica napus]
QDALSSKQYNIHVSSNNILPPLKSFAEQSSRYWSNFRVRTKDKPMEHSAMKYISYLLKQKGKKITNKELVLGVREFLEYECYAQQPGLNHRDSNTYAPFIC